MIRLLSLVLCVVLLQLGGCALAPSLQGDVVKQVQRYDSAQEYGKALDLIASVPADHPQHARLAQKKTQIEARARQFEQNAIHRAGEFAAQNRWGDALNVYRDALDKLPKSTALRTDLQEFRRRQTARVQELEVDQLVAKARWLERAIAVQQSIVTTDPDDWGTQRDLASLKESASDVAKELTRIGVAALEANNLGVAGRALPIASRLAPNAEAQRASSLLSFQEATQENAQQNSQRRALLRYRDQEGKKLLDEYKQASRGGDLRRAHIIMTRLQDMDGDNPEVVREGARLEEQLQTVIKKHMDDGNSLYGRGKFKEAISAWNKVLDLDPENEPARNNLDRASRVLDKLKQLRDEQSANPNASAP